MADVRDFLLRLLNLTLFLLMGLLAQVPRSQHGTVTQRVGTTDITISYNRPVARGRTLFGDDGVVHWGRLWHPGADSVTTISFNKEITVEGHALPAGRYSLWTITAKLPEPWTVIFNRGVGGWHTNYPGESQDALRIKVATEIGPHIETLTWYFPMVDADSAILALHWGTMVLPMRIRTQ